MIDLRCVGAHLLGAAGDRLNRLARRRERGQITGRLHLRRRPAHDFIHDLASFLV
ncbi:hypothetical protein SDC9_124164 [bioreactor metagenome]|uniref:Uncharacterized protein n=1 Tax=bioreactor metagenome TaxID=1076179 RepID=A0A645CJP5_9ZZZZ